MPFGPPVSKATVVETGAANAVRAGGAFTSIAVTASTPVANTTSMPVERRSCRMATASAFAAEPAR